MKAKPFIIVNTQEETISRNVHKHESKTSIIQQAGNQKGLQT